VGSRLVTASIAVLLIIGQFTSPAWAYKHLVHVEGFISSIDSYGSSFSLDTRRYGSGSVTVLVRENTALLPRVSDDDEQEEIPFHRASVRDFREGDVVLVDGFALRGNRILAVQIGIRNRGYAGVPFPTIDPYRRFIAQGVVTSKDSRMMTIREYDGRQRTIFVPPNTRVTGDRASFAEIAINDRVRVDGVATYDQSVVATDIAVMSADGFRVSGRITFMSNYASQPVLVLDNEFTVRVSAETQILSGGQARSLYDLRVGQAVTAIGTPLVASGIVVGVNAKLITY
jgi:hypothetical protein